MSEFEVDGVREMDRKLELANRVGARGRRRGSQILNGTYNLADKSENGLFVRYIV